MTRARSISILCAVLGLDSLLLASWTSVRGHLKDVTILWSTVEDWRPITYIVPMLVTALGFGLAMRKPKAPLWALLNGVIFASWATLFLLGPILSSSVE